MVRLPDVDVTEVDPADRLALCLHQKVAPAEIDEDQVLAEGS